MHRVIIGGLGSRERAKAIIDRAPPGYVMTLAEPKRTLDQNDLLWSCLTDISIAKPMGRRMIPEEWKCVFMAAAGWECQFVEGLDGRPFPMGFRSSKLTKKQMSDLLDFILAWGAENGIRWTHEREAA